MESFSSHKKSNKLFVIIIIKTVSLISAPLLSIIIIAMKRQKSCQEKNVWYNFWYFGYESVLLVPVCATEINFVFMAYFKTVVQG